MTSLSTVPVGRDDHGTVVVDSGVDAGHDDIDDTSGVHNSAAVDHVACDDGTADDRLIGHWRRPCRRPSRGADQLAGEADPAELADIEAHRSLWESMKPTEYTMLILAGRRTSRRRCSRTARRRNPLRVIVVDRRPVEVTGLSSGCSLPADESVPTVEGLFDLAATAAAASEHSILLDDRWGYVNSIDAFEGNFGAFGGVRWLVPAAAPAHVDAEVEPALDQARRTWDASHPSDYSFDLHIRGLQPVGRHVPRHRRATGSPPGSNEPTDCRSTSRWPQNCPGRSRRCSM